MYNDQGMNKPYKLESHVVRVRETEGEWGKWVKGRKKLLNFLKKSVNVQLGETNVVFCWESVRGKTIPHSYRTREKWIWTVVCRTLHFLINIEVVCSWGEPWSSTKYVNTWQNISDLHRAPSIEISIEERQGTHILTKLKRIKRSCTLRIANKFFCSV